MIGVGHPDGARMMPSGSGSGVESTDETQGRNGATIPGVIGRVQTPMSGRKMTAVTSVVRRLVQKKVPAAPGVVVVQKVMARRSLERKFFHHLMDRRPSETTGIVDLFLATPGRIPSREAR